jgi:hypothetical protein
MKRMFGFAAKSEGQRAKRKSQRRFMVGECVRTDRGAGMLLE